MSQHHLTLAERGQIQALRREGKGYAAIGEVLGRPRSTIWREVKRNGTKSGYEAQRAQRWYRQRREQCRPAKKLTYRPLWNLVFDKIPEGWSPEEIQGRLPIEYPEDPNMRISYEALYQNLYSDPRLHCLIADLPQARPKRRKRGQGKTRRGPLIPNRVGIEERPQVVDERSRYGDWEGDTIVGNNHKGFIATMVERKSLLLRAWKVETKQADEVAQAIIDGMQEMPVSWVKTITFDNGSEFAHHKRICAILPAHTYFADPYASYQRGTNENTNGLLRRYFPKRSDFHVITQQQLDRVVEQLNNRPRKKLGYRTPNEVFHEQQLQARVAFRS